MIKYGDIGHNCYFLLSGRVSILKPVEYKEIRITTPTDTYTFKLPRPVAVPSNIDQASAALYITLDLLGVKPTVKRKTARK